MRLDRSYLDGALDLNVELVITNKNDFRTSLDKLGSAATVKYSVQSTLTDPKNEILVDIVYPEESGYTAENGWLHMANNSMPERVIFTYDVNKVLRERQATVYIYHKGYENKKKNEGQTDFSYYGLYLLDYLRTNRFEQAFLIQQ